MSDTKPKVALFGLGLMGAGMAQSLLRAGFPVALYNRTKAKADAFVKSGATAATTPGEAAKGADVLVSMVADDPASRGVWLGEDGALAAAKPGAVAIECSTLSVAWVKELAEAAGKAGCKFLDAPVTGSRTHAAAGELSFLTGGDVATIEEARPVLEAMGKAIIHLGPVGSGAIMKIINNFYCGVQAAGLAEAVSMIERSGLNLQEAGSVLCNGAPGSPLVNAVFPRMTEGIDAPHFHLALMAKDLAYSLKEGENLGLSLNLVAAALGRFQDAVNQGLGEKDFSAVVEALR